MRLAWEFFRRDATVALSYRFSFAVQVLGNFLLLGLFYYIGKTLGPQQMPSLAEFNGNFLAFLLIGIALGDCVGVSLTTFAQQIREGQLTGTLEATLMSAVPLPAVLLYSALWNYFFSACRFLLYLVIGGFLYGVNLGEANFASVVLVFLLTVISFVGAGVLWATAVMIIKRGESLIQLVGYVVMLAAGVLFPVSVLPGWVQSISTFIPLTHALTAMRLAILKGASIQEIGAPIVNLAIFALILPILGFAAFGWATDQAKRHGSLTEF